MDDKDIQNKTYDERIFEMQLRALSNLVRVDILKTVSKSAKSVIEISREVGLSQPSSSNQVNTLWGAGFLNKRKEGKHVYYELNKDAFKRFQKRLAEYIKLR